MVNGSLGRVYPCQGGINGNDKAAGPLNAVCLIGAPSIVQPWLRPID